MGEPLRNQSGVEQGTILVPSTNADYSITVFNLAGIYVVDLLTPVLLTGPLGRAAIQDSLLDVRIRLGNGQRRLVLIASNNNAFPAGLLRGVRLLLRGGGFLREQRHRRGENPYRREQQNEQLTCHVTSFLGFKQ